MSVRAAARPRGEARRGAFWTFATLEARNAEAERLGKPIISDFKPERGRQERASYNLSVGREIYISPASEDGSKSRELLEERECRAIPPGQFAFLHTEEVVAIPNNAIAFIALRSKATKFRGLVNVSGFYVEPGYVGNLVFAVFNAGPAAIHVGRGDKWFEIFFADLDGDTEELRAKDTFRGIPNELITPLSDQFHSLPGLEKKIEAHREAFDGRLKALEREHSVLRWSLALILGAVIAFGVRTCSDGNTGAGNTNQASAANRSGR